MKLVLADVRAYDAFQFWWIGLQKAKLPSATLQQAITMHSLHLKLSAVSKSTPGGGRVLLRECEIEITREEQILLLTAIANTNWEESVFSNVRRACEFLGAEFEQKEERLGSE